MKYNIAISGTFNVENYGDLMFPVIFKKAMEQRGLDFELFLFSPEKTCPKPLDDSIMVYSISQINEIHQQHPLNAIVVGGGALVHYNKIVVKFPDSDNTVDYDITESWLYPIEFAMRNNIQLIFNLPQVPFPIDKTFIDVTKNAFDACDYISFRDEMSKEYLLEAYNHTNSPDIQVFPDSVCCMPELIKKAELTTIKNTILPFGDKYAVIQFNPQKPDNDDEYLVQIIEHLKEENLKVVLLPIGYTHNDDHILETFNKTHNTNCVIIDKKLSILETASILANCEIYIGSSFHGAITAIAYGKMAISYNYIYPKNKNLEIFRMYDIPKFAAETAEEVLQILKKVSSGEISFSPSLNYVQNQLKIYFDNIYSLINNPAPKSSNNYGEFVKSLLKFLPQTSKLIQKNSELYNQIKSQTEYSAKLEDIISTHLAEVEKCHKYISNLEIQLKDASTQLAETQKQLNTLENHYNKIRNNLFIRALLFIKRTFRKK